MIGIVCGTRLEAAILTDLGLHQLISIAISGASPDRAEARARDLVAAGVTHLLSAGVAGGLDPALKSGDLVIGELVLGPSGHRLASLSSDLWGTDLSGADLSGADRGCAAKPPGQRVAVLGVDKPIMHRRTKADLHAHTRAAIVDMESHRVALVAEEHDLPFGVVRAVADPASLSLPPSALAGLDAQGREHFWPVLKSLWQRPGDAAAVIQLAFHYRRALKSLARFARSAEIIIPATRKAEQPANASPK